MSFFQFRLGPQPLSMYNFLCPTQKTAAPCYTRPCKHKPDALMLAHFWFPLLKDCPVQYHYRSPLPTIRSTRTFSATSASLFLASRVENDRDDGLSNPQQSSDSLVDMHALAAPEPEGAEEQKEHQQAAHSHMDGEGLSTDTFEDCRRSGQPTSDFQTFGGGSYISTVKRGRGRPPTNAHLTRKLPTSQGDMDSSHAQAYVGSTKQKFRICKRGSQHKRYTGSGALNEKRDSETVKRGRGRPPKDSIKKRRGPGRPPR